MKSENSQAPIHILLAEDDLDDRLFFEQALKKIPIATQLVTVNDGAQLMQYLKMNPMQLPDVLFLDLSMPGKTGFECLMEIKEDADLKTIPVFIFTTSFGRSSDYEQSLIETLSSLGSLAYIRKPGDFEELKSLIHSYLLQFDKGNVAKTNVTLLK